MKMQYWTLQSLKYDPGESVTQSGKDARKAHRGPCFDVILWYWKGVLCALYGGLQISGYQHV